MKKIIEACKEIDCPNWEGILSAVRFGMTKSPSLTPRLVVVEANVSEDNVQLRPYAVRALERIEESKTTMDSWF